MRPSELVVRFTLLDLSCKVAEESGGDEPYLWVLGFKVDRETMKAPSRHPAIPTLGVKVFEGPLHFRHIAGAGSVSPETHPTPISIPAAMGVREFHLKPDRLPIVGWFPGLCGIICLLWESDSWSPETSEEAFRAFRDGFGPALANQLNNLVHGDYDHVLSRDHNNQVIPGLEAMSIPMRLDRLNDVDTRIRAVDAMKKVIVSELKERITDAVTPWFDELVDMDHPRGAQVQIYLGNELGWPREYELDYKEAGAHYTIRGNALSRPTRTPILRSNVVGYRVTWHEGDRHWASICDREPQEYYSSIARNYITTRFELVMNSAPMPSTVRWFLNGERLFPDRQTVEVRFDPLQDSNQPSDALVSQFIGGISTLHYKINGPVLEIGNNGGNGVFKGEVQALFAYTDDPDLTDELDSGYLKRAEIHIPAVELHMDSEWNEHVADCIKRESAKIDRMQRELRFELPISDGSNPPPFHNSLIIEARLVRQLNIQMLHDPDHDNPLTLDLDTDMTASD